MILGPPHLQRRHAWDTLQVGGGQPVDAEVCLVIEGCYPYRGGGVSVWVDDLMQGQVPTTFSVVSIQSGSSSLIPVFEVPANLHSLSTIRLGAGPTRWVRGMNDAVSSQWLAATLRLLSQDDPLGALMSLIDMVRRLGPERTRGLAGTRVAWEAIREMYESYAPTSSFLLYYWAWQALFGGLLDVLTSPLPRARIYHATSTGFAGLFAARAAVETGRPMLLTEHGVYTNERLAEILAATWLHETLDIGLLENDPRVTLREVWLVTFEALARIAFAAASETTTLFAGNQAFQLELGADRRRMNIVPNGIEAYRYAGLARADRNAVPTIALIGRVVPIKDIKTFVRVTAKVRKSIPQLRALVLGSCEEAPAYALECRQLANRLGVSDAISFPGEVDVIRYLPSIHVHVLTSLSEAQPFAILEAGAAGIACVATDVGACRSLILGEPGVDAALGAGGAVVEPLAVNALAQSIIELLLDHERRERCGEAMRTRVQTHYRRQDVMAGYRALYARYLKRDD